MPETARSGDLRLQSAFPDHPALDGAAKASMNGLFKRELGHGRAPHRGWRLAWYEPRRRVGVYYPAPLHLLARTLREVCYRVGLAWRAPTREQHDVFDLQRVHREREKLAAEYSRGYLRGWQDCFDQWVETIDLVTVDDLKH